MKPLTKLHRLVLLLLLTMSVSLVDAQNKIPLDPRVRTGKLSNGMTYYIQKNTKPEKRVELRLAVNAGSVLEEDNQLGLAHLVEHMGFNGTKNFEKNELVDYLESVGVKFGADLNAYTSFDETVYMLTIPTDSAGVLDTGIKIMNDWAQHMTFDPAEIDKERGVVVEEWRLGQGAGKRMADKYFPVLFSGSKYANRLPIGKKEIIEGASYETIAKFYKDWYRPDLMAFIVVGDIDPDQIEQKIKAEFGSFKGPEKPRERKSYQIPDNKEPLISIVSDKENPYNSFFVMYKAAKEETKTTSDYLRQQSYSMFTGMLNQRFNELLKNNDPPFLMAQASFGPLLRSKSAYQLNAYVPENGIERGLKTVLLENERVKKYGFTQQEFERYKKNMLNNLERAYNERDKTESGNIVRAYVSHFLQNSPAPGIEFQYTFMKENIDKIKLRDINSLAGKWIQDKNQVVIVMGSEKEGVNLPTEADIKRIMKEVSTAKVEPYKEDALPDNILKEKPVAGKIVAEEKVEDLGITELTLSNGLKVKLKPTDFKNDEILMSAYSFGGSSDFPEVFYLSANMATSVIRESGVGAFSKFDLSKMLAGKTVGVSPYVSTYDKGFNGHSSVAELETMMKLIYLHFTAPRRDQEAFESYIARQKASYQNLLTDPTNYFFNEVYAVRYNNDPRKKYIPDAEDWDKVKLDEVMKIYQESFKNAGSFEFYFVGSFDVEKIKPLLETYLGGLPSGKRETSYADTKIRPIQGPYSKKVLKGTDPKSFVSIFMEGPGEHNMLEAHKMWSLGNILKRIYTEKLREEMSGVYGMSAHLDMQDKPYPHYLMELTIPCSPDNVDILVKAALAEIENIKKNGVQEKDLQKEIEAQKKDIEVDLKTNHGWVWRLVRTKSRGEDYTRLRQPYELTKVINSKDLQEIANKYLDLSKVVQVALYPEGKVEEKTLQTDVVEENK